MIDSLHGAWQAVVVVVVAAAAAAAAVVAAVRPLKLKRTTVAWSLAGAEHCLSPWEEKLLGRSAWLVQRFCDVFVSASATVEVQWLTCFRPHHSQRKEFLGEKRLSGPWA